MNKLLLLLTLCLYTTLPAAYAGQHKGIVTFSGFTAGNGLLLAYLQKEIHYAPDALEDGGEGHVLVMLEIDGNGAITDIRLFKDSRFYLEVNRVIKALPHWIPCSASAESIKGFLWLKIQFSLVR